MHNFIILDKPYFDYKYEDETCFFLGSLVVPERFKQALSPQLDLYFSEQGGVYPTVIARYSLDDPDYSSGIGVAQYSVQEMVTGGFADNAVDALKAMIEKTNHMTVFELTVAALLAIEQGYLPESFFKNQINNKSFN